MKPSLLLVGLGNKGSEYDRTRHNVGFAAVEYLSQEFGEGEWMEKAKFDAVIQEGRVVTVPVLLVQPQTYMNLSGTAVKKLVDFYKLDPKDQILVFCDDVDLSLGDVRYRESGGPGTHNGLKSLVEVFGEDFPRVRIGIGEQPAGADLSNWVLSRATGEEEKKLIEAYEKVPKIVREFVLGDK